MERQAAESRKGLSFEDAAASGLGRWPAGTVFLAAVSGGADSTAMLAALVARGQPENPVLPPFTLRCLHVDHGIRPAAESRGDAEAVAALCSDLGVPCTIVSIEPGTIARAAKKKGIGIEAAARQYRHSAWNREARRTGAAKVLVAHTREDLLETALMRFLRGSGPAGLAAMPRSRGRILRPILDQGRPDVLGYLSKRGIPYRTDSTNGDPAFLRNRIRHKLIPCLDEFFPSWRKTILDLAETQRLTADFLASESATRLPWKYGSSPAHCSLPEERFFSQPEILREEALFAALDRLKGGEKGTLRETQPRRRSLRLFTRETVSALDLGFAGIKRDGGGVTVFSRRKASYETGFSLLIKGPGLYKLRGLIIQVFPAAETGSADAVGFFADLPLVLRRNYSGDRIFRGGRKCRAADIIEKTGPSGYTNIITAEDIRGTAAFIGQGRDGFRILLAREEDNRDSRLSFLYIGGIDAQRSE